MNKDDIFKKIAVKLWEEEMADQNNYNYQFKNFQRDFLRLCSEELDGLIFVKGEVIE